MAEARPRRRSSIGERARSVSDALASDALGDRWPAEGQATAAAPAPPSPIIEAPAPKGLFFTGDPEKDHDMANLVLLSIILALDGCYCLALALANDDGATATRLFGAFVVASRREEEKSTARGARHHSRDTSNPAPRAHPRARTTLMPRPPPTVAELNATMASMTSSGVFYTFSVAYFVCDTIFILRVPACCKTPSVIVGHHVVVMLYTLIPFFYPGQSPREVVI